MYDFKYSSQAYIIKTGNDLQIHIVHVALWSSFKPTIKQYLVEQARLSDNLRQKDLTLLFTQVGKKRP